MWRISYLGYSKDMLSFLNGDNQFELAYVVGTKGRLSDEYLKLARTGNYEFVEIEDKNDLLSHEEIFLNSDVVLMYKFEFIIPESMIKRSRIINFHGGDLKTNRGSHAVVWSVLLREKSTCLSCYELTGGIDEGYLIDQYDIEINRDDSVTDVNAKLAHGIPKLLESLKEYFLGKREAVLVTDGIYRRKVEKVDYTIDIENDFVDEIRGKILSQTAYNGAVVIKDRTEYRTKSYKNIDPLQCAKRREIVAKDNTITIKDADDGIMLYMCNYEDIHFSMKEERYER